MSSKNSVRVGQIWADCDERRAKRNVKILRVSDNHALVENTKTKRETVVLCERLRRTTRGYRLVRDVRKSR